MSQNRSVWPGGYLCLELTDHSTQDKGQITALPNTPLKYCFFLFYWGAVKLSPPSIILIYNVLTAVPAILLF